jgi:ABC-2 type transport system permease protein
MFERIGHMLIKEFIQVFRDPRMLIVIFVIPCAQVLIISYAVSTDVTHIRTALYDLDNSQASRDLTARFIQSGYFDVTERIGDDARAQYLIDRSDVSMVLRFNHGFAEDLNAGRTARLQIIIDGTDSNTAAIIANYATAIATAYSEQVLTERVERAAGPAGKTGRFRLLTRAWFNENLDSRNYFVPGVIVIVVGLATLLLTSMSIVREKEIGTMEQIMVTPIRPAEFILGKTIPFAIIGFLDVTLVMLIAVFWFEIPVRGSVPLLYGCTGLFLMTTLGLGLWISTISRTQQQAMMTTFFFFFPAMLLSGFNFPIANMPTVVQWLTLVNPIRYFLAIIRAIFLQGVGIEVLWPEMLPLFLMGSVLLWMAVRRFHKTL